MAILDLSESGGVKKKTTTAVKTSPAEIYQEYQRSRQQSENVARESGGTTGYTSGSSGAVAGNRVPVSNPNTGRPTQAPSPVAQVPAANPARDYYQEMQDLIKEQQRIAEQKRQAQINAGVDTLSGQKGTLADQRDAAAREAYAQLMQSQRALPQAMSAQGLGGGLTETSLASLDANYGNNVAALNRQYNQGLTDIDMAINNLKTSGDLSILDSTEAYNQLLLDLARQQQQEQAALTSRYTGGAYGGTSAGTAATRQLTYAQALELAKQTGFSDPTAINTLGAYGVDVDGLRSAYSQQAAKDALSNDKTAMDWVERAEQNLSPTGIYRNRPEQEREALLGEALLLAVQQGQLTRKQAQLIAEQQYGIRLNF